MNEVQKKLMYAFLNSLSLCDHLGDVGNDVKNLFEKLGVEWPEKGWPWEDAGIMREWLKQRGHNETLCGISLLEEE